MIAVLVGYNQVADALPLQIGFLDLCQYSISAARIHQHNAPVVFQDKTGVVTGGCQCVSGSQYDQSFQRTFLTDRRWNRWVVCLKKVRVYRDEILY